MKPRCPPILSHFKNKASSIRVFLAICAQTEREHMKDSFIFIHFGLCKLLSLWVSQKLSPYSIALFLWKSCLAGTCLMSNVHSPHNCCPGYTLKTVGFSCATEILNLDRQNRLRLRCCGGESTAFIFSRLPQSLPPTPLCIIHLSSLRNRRLLQGLFGQCKSGCWPTLNIHKKIAAKCMEYFGTSAANSLYAILS